MKNNILIKKVATIDIGSNAIRLLISNIIRLDGKLYHTKNSLHRVPVRLGQDSFLNSKIADSSKNKLINTIKSFKYLMEANEINEYLAYATSAMRNASNGQEILDFPLDIILRQIGHTEHKQGTSGHYDNTEFLDKRRDFVNEWSLLLVKNGLKI